MPFVTAEPVRDPASAPLWTPMLAPVRTPGSMVEQGLAPGPRSPPITQRATSRAAGELGGYVRVRLLGSGTYGRVYAVTRASDGARFALKTQPCDQEGVSASALREISALLRVSHPHAGPRVHRVLLDAAAVHVVTDLYDGTLDDDMRRLPPERRLADLRDVTRQLLGALAHCHAAGLLHRDVKPANVLVRRPAAGAGPPIDGARVDVCLADLGLSRHVTRPDDPCTPDVCTSGFKAPELLPVRRHTPILYTAAVDVWAAACTLFAFVTGSMPVEPRSRRPLRVRSVACDRGPPARPAERPASRSPMRCAATPSPETTADADTSTDLNTATTTIDTDTNTDPDSNADSDADADADSDADADTDNDTDNDTGSGSGSGTGTETGSESESGSGSGPGAYGASDRRCRSPGRCDDLWNLCAVFGVPDAELRRDLGWPAGMRTPDAPRCTVPELLRRRLGGAQYTLLDARFVDLLTRMLDPRPSRRITAAKAMRHAFLCDPPPGDRTPAAQREAHPAATQAQREVQPAAAQAQAEPRPAAAQAQTQAEPRPAFGQAPLCALRGLLSPGGLTGPERARRLRRMRRTAHAMDASVEALLMAVELFDRYAAAIQRTGRAVAHRLAMAGPAALAVASKYCDMMYAPLQTCATAAVPPAWDERTGAPPPSLADVVDAEADLLLALDFDVRRASLYALLDDAAGDWLVLWGIALDARFAGVSHPALADALRGRGGALPLALRVHVEGLLPAGARARARTP